MTESEYKMFDRLTAGEVRKNRYFHEFDLKLLTFDIYLGALSGLGTVCVDLANRQEYEDFEPPLFAVLEVTDDPFFEGHSLADKSFALLRAEVERLGHQWPAPFELQDE